MSSEFEKYARKHCGISSLSLHDFQSVSASYVSPTIIEERQLNVATMDVFSRLMMDRIIFLGAPIYDDAANIIQAQLLFLASTDSSADISLYINTPGGQVTSGLAIYDTMQYIKCDVSTICMGMAASMGAFLLSSGAKGKRIALWGLAFKPETDDMREAPSLVLIEKLRNAGCLVSAYDPVAIPEAQRRLPEDVISYVKDIYEAVIDADALLLVTEWKEFRMPSWSVIKKLMATPLILDGRNIYDKAELEEAGFIYHCIGR